MKRLLLWLVMLYRNSFSLYKLQSCRFIPSCSAYAEEAIQRLGLWRGFIKMAWRILRCQPLCRGGYDPVIPPTSRPT